MPTDCAIGRKPSLYDEVVCRPSGYASRYLNQQNALTTSSKDSPNLVTAISCRRTTLLPRENSRIRLISSFMRCTTIMFGLGGCDFSPSEPSLKSRNFNSAFLHSQLVLGCFLPCYVRYSVACKPMYEYTLKRPLLLPSYDVNNLVKVYMHLRSMTVVKVCENDCGLN